MACSNEGDLIKICGDFTVGDIKFRNQCGFFSSLPPTNAAQQYGQFQNMLANTTENGDPLMYGPFAYTEHAQFTDRFQRKETEKGQILKTAQFNNKGDGNYVCIIKTTGIPECARGLDTYVGLGKYSSSSNYEAIPQKFAALDNYNTKSIFSFGSKNQNAPPIK